MARSPPRATSSPSRRRRGCHYWPAFPSRSRTWSRRRAAHHRGLAHARGLGRPIRRHRDIPAPGGRVADLARPTWTSSRWARRPSTPVRPNPQPMGHRAHPRWLRRRFGGGRRRLRGSARHWDRYRRIDPPACGDDRYGRHEADVRGRLAVRPDRPRKQPRPGRPVTRTVMDAALLHEVIAGLDPFDSTSIDRPVPPVVEAARRADVSGLRIGVVTELAGRASMWTSSPVSRNRSNS